MLGYWPGSAVHQRATLAHPRFEDFEYTSFDPDEEDCLGWMGNGMVLASMNKTSTTGYLDNVDIPPVPCEALESPASASTDAFSLVEQIA